MCDRTESRVRHLRHSVCIGPRGAAIFDPAHDSSVSRSAARGSERGGSGFRAPQASAAGAARVRQLLQRDATASLVGAGSHRRALANSRHRQLAAASSQSRFSGAYTTVTGGRHDTDDVFVPHRSERDAVQLFQDLTASAEWSELDVDGAGNAREAHISPTDGFAGDRVVTRLGALLIDVTAIGSADVSRAGAVESLAVSVLDVAARVRE